MAASRTSSDGHVDVVTADAADDAAADGGHDAADATDAGLARGAAARTADHGDAVERDSVLLYVDAGDLAADALGEEHVLQCLCLRRLEEFLELGGFHVFVDP